MRSMYDVLYLPDPAPSGYDIAAGYVPSPGIAYPWTAGDWQRAARSSRWLLPIAGCWPPFGNGSGDAIAAVTYAPAGYPQGVAFALDVEEGVAQEAHDTGYVAAWCARMVSLGVHPVVYCSASTGHLFGFVDRWLAEWTGQPHMARGAVATQYVSPSVDPALHVDVSVVADVLPVWDTHPQPSPMPPGVAEMERVILTPQSGATAIETEPGKFVKVAHQQTVDGFRQAGWKALPVPNDDYQRIVGEAP